MPLQSGLVWVCLLFKLSSIPLITAKYRKIFPFTNVYKQLQPKVNGCLPNNLSQPSQLCIVDLKQQYQTTQKYFNNNI